jgi:gas vesicle protein
LFAGLLMKPGKTDKKNPIAALQAFADRIKSNDPDLKIFIKKELKHSLVAKQKEELSKEIIRRLKIQNKKLMEQVGLLKEKLKQTKLNRNQVLNRLADFRKRDKALADGLGSCSVCWGEDTNCKNCGGNGSPGWKNASRRLFNIYILPVLEKMYGFNK